MKMKEQTSANQPAHIIVLANLCHGAGRTTAAAAISVLLARRHRTLCIDFNNVTSLTRIISDGDTKHDIGEVVFGDVPIQDAIYWSSTSSPLMYIPGGDGPREGEYMYWLQELHRDVVVRDRLQEVRDHFDYILIDTDFLFDGSVHAALVAATGILVPVTARSRSEYGAINVETWANRLRHEHPSIPKPLYFVSIEPENGLPDYREEWLQSLDESQVLETRIPELESKFVENGAPLVAWRSYLATAEAYERLIDELTRVFPPSAQRDVLDPRTAMPTR